MVVLAVAAAALVVIVQKLTDYNKEWLFIVEVCEATDNSDLFIYSFFWFCLAHAKGYIKYGDDSLLTDTESQ